MEVTEEDVAAAEAAVAAAEAGTPDAPAEEEVVAETPETTEPARVQDGLEITPEEAAAAEAEVTAGLDMESLSAEFASSGTLTDESRTTVLDALRPQFGAASEDVLNSYIGGLAAQATAATTAAHEQAGGAENFTSMIDWAADNWDASEIDAYNLAVSDSRLQNLAIAGLRSQYEAASGTSPDNPALSRVSSPAVSSAGTGAINSMQQVSDLVSTKEYANDPGHRQSVDAQIAAAAKAGRI